MQILELDIKHFGKFANHRIRLTPGMNIIYGGNESGKSTVHAFIRAMLFGFERSRGRMAQMDEYRQYRPWENGAYFAGSMKIRDGARTLVLERSFDRNEESFRIWDEGSARELENPREQVQVLMNYMSQEAFENTCYARQQQLALHRTQAFTDLLRQFSVQADTGDSQNSVDVSAAVTQLRKQQKQLEQKKRAEARVLEEQIQKRQTEADFVRRSMDQKAASGPPEAGMQTRAGSSPVLQGTAGPYAGDTPAMQGKNGRTETSDQGRPQQQDVRNGEDLLSDMTRQEEVRSRRYRSLLSSLLIVAAMLCAAGAVLLPMQELQVFLGIFSGIFLLCLIPVWIISGKGTNPFKNGPEWEESEEEARQSAAGRSLQADPSALRNEQELQGSRVQYQKLQGELEQLYQDHVALEGIDLEIEAMELAVSRIRELSSGFMRGPGLELEQKTSRLIQQLTQGRYTAVSLDDEMDIRIRCGNRLLSMEQISRGTRQQVWFSVRMAAGEIFAQGAQIPLVLDDPFADWDDDRLEKALRWLYGCGRQVILFTCRERERELLERIRN